MEKEKMIQEIEAILEQEQIKIANTVEEFTKLQKVGITRCNAEALYNANCLIVSEGTFVLTKEEYDRFEKIKNDMIQKKEEYIEGLMELKKEKENVRQEARKEVLDDVFTPYNEIGGGLYELTPNDKKMLYKKFGVEVEE